MGIAMIRARTPVRSMAGLFTGFTLSLKLSKTTVLVNEETVASGILSWRGRPLPNQTVTVYSNDKEVASVKTDAMGLYSTPLSFTAAGSYSIHSKYARLFITVESKTVTLTVTTPPPEGPPPEGPPPEEPLVVTGWLRGRVVVDEGIKQQYPNGAIYLRIDYPPQPEGPSYAWQAGTERDGDIVLNATDGAFEYPIGTGTYPTWHHAPDAPCLPPGSKQTYSGWWTVSVNGSYIYFWSGSFEVTLPQQGDVNVGEVIVNKAY